MSDQGPQTTPAGWYPDGSGNQRYWDGQAWTDQVKSASVPPPPPASSSTPGYPSSYPTTGQDLGHAPTSFGTVEPSTGNTFSIIGICLGVVAFLFCPPLTGGAGIGLAFVGRSKGERLWKAALIVSILGLVVGMIIGLVIGVGMFADIQNEMNQVTP